MSPALAAFLEREACACAAVATFQDVHARASDAGDLDVAHREIGAGSAGTRVAPKASPRPLSLIYRPGCARSRAASPIDRAEIVTIAAACHEQ